MTVNDGKDLSQDPHAKDLEALGVKIVDGGHPLSLLDNEPIIVKNPGIPYTVSIIQEAYQRHLKILTEVELSYLISETDYSYNWNWQNNYEFFNWRYV